MKILIATHGNSKIIFKFTQNDEKGIKNFILKLGALSHKFLFNIDVIDDVIKAK